MDYRTWITKLMCVKRVPVKLKKRCDKRALHASWMNIMNYNSSGLLESANESVLKIGLDEKVDQTNL